MAALPQRQNENEKQGALTAAAEEAIRSESRPTTLSSQDDIAATFLPAHAQPIDPEIARRVRRKIDLFFIPLMWIGYGFVYYDKVGLPVFRFGAALPLLYLNPHSSSPATPSQPLTTPHNLSLLLPP